MKTCESCGKEQSKDRFNPDCPSPDLCFRCRISGVSLGFSGNQEFFHNDTIKGFRDRTISEGRANGIDPEPITNHNAGISGKQLKKLDAHFKSKEKSSA